MNAPRASSVSEVLSKDEALDDEDELEDPDRIETSGDIISGPEMDEQQRIDQVCSLDEDFYSKKMLMIRVPIWVMKSEVIMKEVF
jgi:hypothetical protein